MALIILTSLFLLGIGPSLAADLHDHAAWDAFLKKYVNEAGEVQYQAVADNPDDLNAYLDELASVNNMSLGRDWTREEKLALYLNAYHAGVIRLIIEHWPVETIQEIPGVWDLPAVRIGKESHSLNHLRSQDLIGAFRDEKIHLALACGAKGCPRLRKEAYSAMRVEGQLFLATQEFVNDPNRTIIYTGAKKIELSRIFKWYGSDFRLDFAGPDDETQFSVTETAVLSFIAHYLQEADKIDFLSRRKYKIKYLPFEWTLNEWVSDSGAIAR
ncbi:MAG: DUF547 domain-containing protein [Candidatus Omnitrophota bacterium]|nr:DUF547 domain-containing protein [Candidatus Omnitrophota bacterium]